MYSIDKTDYGYKIIFSDKVKEEEMNKWFEDAREIINTRTPGEFGVLVDMRNLMPLDENAKGIIINGQKYFFENGMKRSVVILNSSILILQFIKIAKNSGIDKQERYIDASQYHDWEERALKWLKTGQEPI